MATAIFLAGLMIGGAIRPEFIIPNDGNYSYIAVFLVAFGIYDLLSLRR